MEQNNNIGKNRSVVVVGAGLGGIAAALGLRLQGFNVQVWDRNQTGGGKLQEWRNEGYRWDLGPSLLTMPSVLKDWFELANRKIEDYLTLIPLENTCRYFWQDGKIVDEDEAFWKKPEIQAFLRHGEGVYSLSGKAYLHYPPSEFWKAFHWKNWRDLKHLPQLMSFKTLSQLVEEKINDPYLIQILCRYATYNGSSPYLTPSTFSIIPYVEAHFGGWYIKGGMRKLAEVFEKIAKEEGVEFHYEQEAISYQNRTLRSRQGLEVSPDLLVCNGEVIRAANQWLSENYTEKEKAKLNAPTLSSSGFIILLAVRGENRQLKHHNISFSQDYRDEFKSIFERKELPVDPTIYIAITKRKEIEDAPDGGENWFVLVNAPSKTDFSEGELVAYREKVIQELRRRSLLLSEQSVEYKRHIHAGELAQRDYSSSGALYGWASHTILSSLFRPKIKHPREEIYFVGGSTHPGGGIPLILLSAKMICEKIFKKFFIGKIE